MRVTVFAVAALVAAISTQALAKDIKKASDVSRATQMTDAQMDKITAGTAGGATYNLGVLNPQGHLVPDAAWHGQAKFTCQFCF
jgi:hypothetical protein